MGEHLIRSDTTEATAGATPFLRVAGTVIGAYIMARQAVEAKRRLTADPGNAFLATKMPTTDFSCARILPPAAGIPAGSARAEPSTQ